MSSAHVVPRNDLVEESWNFIQHAIATAESEVRKLAHDRLEMLARIVQPLAWLLLFGPVLSHLREIPTGGLRYIDFIVPGIVAQGVLFVSVVYGVALLWERDAGILQRYLATPASRGALVLGKALSAGVRVMPQVVFIYVLSAILGVQLRLRPLPLLGVLTMVAVGAAIFCTFSLIVACIVKTRERFMGLTQLLTFPFFFASNAIYPVAIMPGWMRRASVVNPLTYLVDALRALMLAGGRSMISIPVDFGILILVFLALLLLASKLYHRLSY